MYGLIKRLFIMPLIILLCQPLALLTYFIYSHIYIYTYEQIKAKIVSESQESKVRVGYPGDAVVTDRKKIKDVIVEMTKASSSV